MVDKVFEYFKDTLIDITRQYNLLKKQDPTLGREGEFVKEFLPIYLSHRSEQQSQRLVWATWCLAMATMLLAIGTLILSGLTIYFQYFK